MLSKFMYEPIGHLGEEYLNSGVKETEVDGKLSRGSLRLDVSIKSVEFPKRNWRWSRTLQLNANLKKVESCVIVWREIFFCQRNTMKEYGLRRRGKSRYKNSG